MTGSRVCDEDHGPPPEVLSAPTQPPILGTFLVLVLQTTVVHRDLAMAFFGRPMGPPPPAVFGKIQYRYHTRDGSVPNEGKVPSATAPPPPQYHAMFGGPPPPYSAGPPWPQWAVPPPSGFMPPQPSGRPGPFRMWAAPCAPTPSAPPGPPYSAPYWQPPPAAPLAMPCVVPPWQTGPPAAPPSSGVDPGNRSLGRTAKFEDGTGVLLGEEQTTFHVLEPGHYFQDSTPWVPLKDQNIKAQSADSEWTVLRLMAALGAGTEARIGRDPNHWSHIGQPRPEAAIEEWHEHSGRQFTRGSAIRESDPRAKLCLKQHGWGPDRGRAGQNPPVWVMLYP